MNLSRFLLTATFLLVACISFSQKKSAFVSGKVVDENENPLPNVSIIILGKTAGITTNDSGYFRIKVQAEKGWFELTEAYRYNAMKGATSNGPMAFNPNVNQQALQMDDFAECVRQNRPSRVGGEEGLKDMKVVEAIYRSIANGSSKEKI